MSGRICLPNVDKNCPRTSTKSKGIELEPFHPTEEQWRNIFSRFDSDRDGHLSKENIENAFKTLGLSPPNKQTFASLGHVDENGNWYEIAGLVQYVMKRGYAIKCAYICLIMSG